MAESVEYQPTSLSVEEVEKLQENNHHRILAWIIEALSTPEQRKSALRNMSWYPIDSNQVMLACYQELDRKRMRLCDGDDLANVAGFYLFKDALNFPEPQNIEDFNGKSQLEKVFAIVKQVMLDQMQKVHGDEYNRQQLEVLLRNTFLEKLANSLKKTGIPILVFSGMLANGSQPGMSTFLNHRGRLPLTMYRRNHLGKEETLRINQEMPDAHTTEKLYQELVIRDLPLFIERAEKVFTLLKLDSLNQSLERLLKDVSAAELHQPLEEYLGTILASINDSRFSGEDEQVALRHLAIQDGEMEKSRLLHVVSSRPKAYDEGTKQIGVTVDGQLLLDVRFDVVGDEVHVKAAQAPEREGKKLSEPQLDIELFEESREKHIRKLLDNIDGLVDILEPWIVPAGVPLQVVLFNDGDFGEFSRTNHARHSQTLLAISDGRPLLDQLDDLVAKWTIELPPDVEHILSDLQAKGIGRDRESLRKNILFALKGQWQMDKPMILVQEQDILHVDEVKMAFKTELDSALRSDDLEACVRFLSGLNSAHVAMRTDSEEVSRYSDLHTKLFNANLWTAFQFVSSNYELDKYRDNQAAVREIRAETELVWPITGRILPQNVLEVMAVPENLLHEGEELADDRVIRTWPEAAWTRMKRLKKAIASLQKALDISQTQAIDIYRRVQPVVSALSESKKMKDGEIKYKSFVTTQIMLSLAVAVARFRDEGIKTITIPDQLPFRRHYDVTRDMSEERINKAFELDTRVQYALLGSAIALAELIDNLEIVGYPDERGLLEMKITGPLSSPHPVISEILQKV